MEYNSFGQLISDYQEHDAVVSVGTSPKVGYRYDRLHRLVDFDRGKLIRDDDLIDPLARKAQWTLDATGNWSRFRRFDQSDSTAALDQTRTHNGVNEVTDIGETVGRIWVSPTHDRAGNMQIIPRPSDPRESYTATYDAWHQLVKVEQSDGAGGLETLAEYQYDGRNYRTLKRTYAGGVLSETRHFYYSSQWQVLEERLDASPAAACQYVWGERYIDDLVLRDRDTTGAGLLNERFYALQDANWNVIAISNPDCQIQERYAYDAYGFLAVHGASFTPLATSAYAWPYTYTGRRLDEETGLMYYRNRMYHAELGRFVNRDPVGFRAGDLNLYRYCTNDPLLQIDPVGHWGADVHRDMTSQWAVEIGFVQQVADWIGDFNEKTDGLVMGKSPLPIAGLGDQDFHFDGIRGAGPDTRGVIARAYIKDARRMAVGLKENQVTKFHGIAQRIGIALHAWQDWVAHADYGFSTPRGRDIWTVHNSCSPQDTFGNPAGYPDDVTLDVQNSPDGRATRAYLVVLSPGKEYACYEKHNKRLLLTEQKTKELLREFRRFVEHHASPDVQNFFLGKTR